MKQVELSIRPSAFSDWGGLHRLLIECFAFMEGRIDPPSSLNRVTPEDLRRKAAVETLVVARCDGELVGCGYLADRDDAIYLGKLAVTPRFRNRGILRSIVTAAAGLARDRGKPALEIQTRIELTENHKTFQSLGFVRTKTTSHEGYDRPTSVTMRKAL